MKKMVVIPSHSYRPLTLLSSCFCTGPGSMVYQTVTFVPLSLLFWANGRSPLQKEIDTRFYNTAARLRTKTLIAGRTACLKRCRLIAQKNNKNDIPSHSYRPLTLSSSCFCTGSGRIICETTTLVPLSVLFWANSRSPLQKNCTIVWNCHLVAVCRKSLTASSRSKCVFVQINPFFLALHDPVLITRSC